MDELEMLRMLCTIAVEQDKEITRQEEAIKELTNEVSEIMGILMDGQESDQVPGD